ncbi:MAG TPA: hypothetical protein VF520_01465 [Thermoleophilaceae bacterium]|jgi:hypothetical protein
MIGYAQLMSDDEDARRQGFRAIRFQLSEPQGARGVFDQLILARAYRFASRYLSGDDAFEDLRDRWRRDLAATADVFFFRAGAWVDCFKSDDCYSNHEMVEAAADVDLLATGVEGRGPRAKLADREALRRRALRTAGELAERAAGTAAYTDSRTGLGLLSDTGPYPLGYHVLSTAFLAMIARDLGDDVPEPTRAALRRSMETLAGFMGPDGDLAYVGARHEQVWVLAAATYAGRAAASVVGPETADGRRYEAIARRALGRLRRAHPLEATGLRVVTRPLQRSYSGIDGALVPANGLSLLFLREASLIPAGPAAPALPVDRPGHSFVDPVHARIAVRRTPELWFAVRARPRFPVDPRRDPDQRFDFGVVNLKERTAGGWRDLVEPRPRTMNGVHSSGPVLLGPGGEVGFPWGERIELRGGGVDVVGGFRARERRPHRLSRPGRWLRRGVVFRYRPRGRSLTVTWDARPGDRFQVLAWARAGAFRQVAGGIEVGAARHLLDPAPLVWSVGDRYSGCCAFDVRPVTGEIAAPAAGPVSWTIAARDR